MRIASPTKPALGFQIKDVPAIKERPSQPKVGIALGAGAFRGLAHIGVLEVLEENRVPIDIITGCSMGSVIGAIYANGTPASFLKAFTIQLANMESAKLLYDLTIPRLGLLKGSKVTTLIQTLLGNDRTFEQLKKPLSVVATNVQTCELRVFNSGPIVPAIRASISVPGVFEPVVIDGQMYVDGGLLDRVPCSIARDMGADFIIAVDVGYRGLNHDMPKNIIEVMMSSYEILEWQAMKPRMLDANIIISPNTQNINPAVMLQAEECIQRGREAATAMVPSLLESLEEAGIPLLGSGT